MPTNIYLKKGIDRFNPPPVVPPPVQFLGKQTPVVFGGLKLNPNHFLAKGMITAWIPGLFGGVDLVGNKNLGVGYAFGATYTTIGSDGAVVALGSNANRPYQLDGVSANDPVVQALLKSGSIYFRGMMMSTFVLYSGYLSIWDAGSGGNAYLAEFYASNNNTAGFITRWPNIWDNGTNWTNVPGATISIGASFGSPGGAANTYVNGALTQTVTYGAAFVPVGPVSFALMQDLQSQNTDIEGVYCAYIWNRQLSDWEQSYLDANPYCMWMPA